MPRMLKYFIGIGVIIVFMTLLLVAIFKSPSSHRITKNKTLAEKKNKAKRIALIRYVLSDSLRGFSFNVQYSSKFFPHVNKMLPRDAIKTCIKTSPELSGSWMWSDYNTLVFLPNSSSLIPDRINFKFKCIPIDSVHVLSMKPVEQNWIFEPVARIKTEYVQENMPTLSLYFVSPVEDTTKARRFIAIKTNRHVFHKIYWKGSQRLVIAFELGNDSIVGVTIRLKRGLVFEGNIELTEDWVKRIKIGKAFGELGVEYVRFQKGGDNGYLECGFVATEGERVSFSRDICEYISFKPRVRFTAFPVGAKVYIYGDFEPGKRYTLFIKSGLRSKEGYVLKRDFSRTFDVPVPEAVLRFLSRGLYIGSTEPIKLPFSIRRIKKLYLKVEWMPPEHIPFYYFAGNGFTDEFYKFGRTIIDEKELPLKNEGYKEKIEFLDLGKYLNKRKKGLYKITLEGKVKEEKYDEYEYVSATMVVAITDLAILAKYSDSSVYVWVFDVKNLAPLNGVKIKVLSDNGFDIGEGTTDGHGLCVVKTDGELEPFIVTAKKGNNWSFINLKETALDLSYFDIKGEAGRKPYSAMLYFERDLYRPGDTVFYNVIVRKSGSYEGVALPVNIEIEGPRGKLLADIYGATDKAGYFGGTYITTLNSRTGKYMFRVYVGGDLYASRSIFVETFVPERISLDIDVPSRVYNTAFNIKLSAMYLFGAPCADLPYTLQVYGKPIRYRSRYYPEYEFGIPLKDEYRKEVDFIEGKLDKNGKAVVFINAEEYLPLKKSNPFKLDIVAAVREGGGGRSTEKEKSTIVFSAPYYIGLRSDKKGYKKGEKVFIDGIIVTPQDTIASSVKYVSVNLYRLIYYYTYWYDEEYDADNLRWDRSRIMVPVKSVDSIPVKEGKFRYAFTYPSDWEDYVVEVVAPSGARARKLIESDWWWAEKANEKPRPPDILNIVLSKDTASENEEITARVKLPFEGWVLWSLELDTVYESKWVKAEGSVAEWSFHVPSGVPCVYVSCVLVRNKGNYLLRRGFGVKRVKILPRRLLLDIDINTPEQVKPKENIVIELKSKEEYEATVAVVDEGVLSITGFKTPDPIGGILKNLRLMLNTSETFGWFSPRYLKTGGGFAERRELVQPRFFSTVTYFSGLLKSKHGKIKLSVPVGNYQGKVRIMVSAFNESKMAKIEKDVIVKSDVVVYVTMPRFLYVNDTFYLPITMLNTTNSGLDVALKIKAKGIIVEDGKRKVRLMSKGKKTLSIKCYAKNPTKKAEIDIYASYAGGKFADTFFIPVYPDKPYVTETKTIRAKPSDKVVYLDSLISGYLKEQHYVSIFATSNIFLQGLYAARGVIGYPYGCVEQTSSKLYMLLALSPFVGIYKDLVTPDELNYYVSSGISRLISMQTWEGGFTFWPGGLTPHKGFSGYATLVLQIAKEKGYYVPFDVLESAYDYLETNCKDFALALYALARGGRLNKIPGGIDAAIKIYRDSKYAPERLWAILALYESGRADLARKFFHDILKAKEEFKGYWLPGYDIYVDPLFDAGLKLYVAERIGFDRHVTDSIARQVNKALLQKEYYFYSTQALVWSLLGLSEYSKSFRSRELNLVLYAGHKKYIPEKIKGGLLLYFFLKEPDGKNVYLSGEEAEYFVTVQNTGFRKTGKLRSVSSGMIINRELFTYDGVPIEDTVLEPGDLIVMKVSWKSDNWAKNVAIEVPVPAGMEIENPRLSKEELPVWTDRFKNYARYEYIDVKDDRVIIFGESTERIHNFFVLLRVNLKGTYFLAPVRGVVMYRPEVYYNGAAKRLVIP